MKDLISRRAVLKLLATMPPEEAITKAMLIQSINQMNAAQPECAKDFVMLKVVDLNGRPYYSIIYLENGNEFEGYSSYDLKVISEYLKRYFGFAQPETHDKRTETHTCDLISRQDAIDAAGRADYTGLAVEDVKKVTDEVIKELKQLPSAQPERKRGKWIYGEDEYGIDGYHCDKCGFFVPWDYAHKFINYIEDYNFCPGCGADMREVDDERPD